MSQETVQAAETHLAEGMASELLTGKKAEKSLMELDEMRKLNLIWKGKQCHL
jgi:hypothetical protein